MSDALLVPCQFCIRVALRVPLGFLCQNTTVYSRAPFLVFLSFGFFGFNFALSSSFDFSDGVLSLFPLVPILVLVFRIMIRSTRRNHHLHHHYCHRRCCLHYCLSQSIDTTIIVCYSFGSFSILSSWGSSFRTLPHVLGVSIYVQVLAQAPFPGLLLSYASGYFRLFILLRTPLGLFICFLLFISSYSPSYM